MPTDRAPTTHARTHRLVPPALVVAVLATLGSACATARTERGGSANAAAACRAPHVAVSNETRASIDVYVVRAGRHELLATVAPGRTELPIWAEDRQFRALPLGANPATSIVHAHPVRFAVTCPGGPTGAP